MKTKIKAITVFLTLLTTFGCSSMNKTIREMYETVDVENVGKLSDEEISHLPETMKQYLRHVNIIGKDKIKTVRVKQGGGFRLKPDDNFKLMTAVQYFNLETMEFFWKGSVSVIKAEDKFIDGKGSMKVKLFGIINLSEMTGAEVDQGELVRFLAEGVWFPTIYINKNISWEEIDTWKVKATLKLNDVTASVVFHFNDKFEVEKITAKRFMEKDGKFTLKDWEVKIIDYKKVNDVLIPWNTEVIWKLDDGDFCWYKPEIYEIEYNVTSTFKE